MGWFWADSREVGAGAGAGTATATATANISLCPVMARDDGKDAQNGGGALNPFNHLPDISPTERDPAQKLALPTDRTVSTIPKGSDPEKKWEYPSPQQMYNAMIRKGKIDPNTGEEIPEDAVEAMVAVHNFLNESCWNEILRWEHDYTDVSKETPKLLRFIGKPGQLSPRARMHYYLSYLAPSYFQRELPFDRHDWVVLRKDPHVHTADHPGYRQIRYVLDFYGGPDDPVTGMPTFSVDVRPGLDNLTNARDRFRQFTKPIWDKYF
ncbi:holocytochrome c synthase CYC3 KNAG_0D05010 [Huiozyma naganishii CBS 8797]|uniref:Holocytochrome c-type synthase n=1 Tax=Huiozyma naganishii (strain ATCC MYA-139 / BCRC 22969 / CBS 8797 / KCTC 17520 / NBRC 10181 / NCYC 3082 / Yp74L-3) TaxID=1071383 RepID=J7R5V4_HUIN7|nr:hypothetical protein KNAG_0D05010 [Kazachstania naganishii CBS 8797]CCK70240.1 hypothetical protein KNAG_0D05010 [Kazachstania naganishii CBS 8797]